MDSPSLTPSNGGVAGEPSPAGVSADVGPALPALAAEQRGWVELAILADLEAELEGPELARGFARDYATLWDQRFGKLQGAVKAEDRVAALDAIISLRIASTMVGGLRLALLAQDLEDAIRGGDFVRGQALLKCVAEHGQHTVSELQANYILKDS